MQQITLNLINRASSGGGASAGAGDSAEGTTEIRVYFDSRFHDSAAVKAAFNTFAGTVLAG